MREPGAAGEHLRMSDHMSRAVDRSTALTGDGTSSDVQAGAVTTYVFVSGANGAPAQDPELTLRGHRCVGVELPGHGAARQFDLAYQAPQDLERLAALPSAVAGVTLDDHVEATVTVVRRAAEHGPVVLVGGSLGGTAITKAADEVPHLIHRLVYDAAFCCTDLRSPAEYLETPEAAGSLASAVLAGIVGDPRVIGAVRVNWRSADRAFVDAVKAAFMEGATDGEVLAMMNTLLPDESLLVSAGDARGRPDAWGRVPRTYIRHTRDRMIPLALQDRMIREADAATPGNGFDVRTVDAPHAPTPAVYRRITEILHRLAA